MNVISNSMSDTLIVDLNLIYLALKICLTFVFHRSLALETEMEEKVDCQEWYVIMYSRHSGENHRQWLVSKEPNKMFEFFEN